MELNYQNILVAVDGSQEAEWAFKKAIQISKKKIKKKGAHSLRIAPFFFICTLFH